MIASIMADPAAASAWVAALPVGRVARPEELVKRQMYGRAKLDLLRARLIVPVS
jgi:hypothetical protein